MHQVYYARQVGIGEQIVNVFWAQFIEAASALKVHVDVSTIDCLYARAEIPFRFIGGCRRAGPFRDDSTGSDSTGGVNLVIAKTHPHGSDEAVVVDVVRGFATVVQVESSFGC